MALCFDFRSIILRFRRYHILASFLIQFVLIILVLLASLFLKQLLLSFVLIYALKIVEALEGSDHVDYVGVHQV